MDIPISVRSRPYDHDRDWWRIRNLIVDTFAITPAGFNWEVRRWDGMRFHGDDAAPDPRWAEWIRVWETSDGRLVGAAHPEGDPGEVHLQLHPDYRRLMDPMLEWAEAALSVPDAERGGRRIQNFAFDYDAPRQRVLTQRGYTQQTWFGMVRRLRFGVWPIPPAEMPAGYTLRTTRPLDADYAAVAALLNAAFRRTIHTAQEYRNFTSHSPSFRHDLDLVAEAPDGTLACLVGVTYEPLGRYGVFEPVCTHPDQQRRGLARALMLEGLRRMREMGALTATVDTGDMVPANALYDAIGFTEAYRGHYWVKGL